MVYPFPGMNPYLERSSLWPDVHLNLISGIQRAIASRLPDRYYISAEERTYITTADPDSFVGRPDVAIVGVPRIAIAPALTMTANGSPAAVVLPVPEKVRERFLEIREVESHRVVTVIEILSPANKTQGEGRRQYEAKRQQVLMSFTSLVEIDLLRGGEPLPASPQESSDYRIQPGLGTTQRLTLHLQPIGVDSVRADSPTTGRNRTISGAGRSDPPDLRRCALRTAHRLHRASAAAEAIRRRVGLAR